MDRTRRVVRRLDHYARRGRYLLARAKKATAGLVTSLVAGVAAIEALDPNTPKEAGLAAAIVALATSLGVWVAPKNERDPDELDDRELHR